MKSSLEHQIGKYKYTITQMDPKTATRMALRLFSLIGYGAGEALGAVDVTNKPGATSILDKKVDFKMDAVGSAVAKLAEKLDDDKTMDLISALLGCVLDGGTNMSWEHAHFQGNTLHLFKVVHKSLEVNFKDFLSGAGGLVGKLSSVLSTIREKTQSSGLTSESAKPSGQPLAS